MEPLESTSIHLVQSAIGRFLSVLPAGRPDPGIADWFNAQAEFEWSRVRDFLVLHYHANDRQGEALWDYCRSMDLPETLAAKIEAWRACGFIHREHEELFTEVAWFQVFAGQDVATRSWSPLADAMPEDALRRFLSDIEAASADAVRPMPRHFEAVQRIAQTRQGVAA
jgi:tryptophan halogenase